MKKSKEYYRQKRIKAKILNKLTETKKPPRCYWCNSRAVRRDYRTIDGTTSKIPSCDKCVWLSTEYLLEREERK